MEIWKEIPDASKYEASNQGQIRLKKNNKILKQFETKSYSKGYLCCRIHFDSGLIRTRLVHRLIAITFLQNIKEEVNHKNGIKNDNKLHNLEWCTRSENIKHAYDTGLKKYRPLHYKGKIGFLHNRSKSIICSNGKVYGSMNQAEKELGLGAGTISISIKQKRSLKNGMHFETAN